MDLSHYRDVHPDWNLVEGLDQPQAEAALDLLVTATVLDGDLTDEELATLAEELSELPFVTSPDESRTLAEALETTRARIDSFEDHPNRFGEFVEEVGRQIQSRDVQLAVLRLLAIDITIDRPTEAQQEFYYAVGHEWDVDDDTLEDVLRTAWTSHEESRDLESGADHDVPPVRGANWARNRSLKPMPNPFTQHET